MSRHFSRYGLNTYAGTPYFAAHAPTDYPLSLVLQKSRAFRRLPPHLQELSCKAKEWAVAHDAPLSREESGIKYWYDDEGYELDPDTGKRLTDEEIDTEWDELEARWGTPDIEVEDIPTPDGGFADPETWEPAPIPDFDEDRPTREQILKDIAERGREAASKEYGIPIEQLPRGDVAETE